jgi:hypothetical protein
MKRFRRLLLLVASMLILGGLVAGGCWLDVGPWHHTGYATLQWTIERSRDLNACARRKADRMEIRIIDSRGRTETHWTARCDLFEDTVLLDTGWYHADLTLIDTSGQNVSSALSTESFRVVHHASTLVAAVDFPGCAPLPMYFPYCPNGTVVERRDAAGCVTGYDCVTDGGAVSACEQAGGRCVAVVPNGCDRWGDPATCGGGMGVGCCLGSPALTSGGPSLLTK